MFTIVCCLVAGLGLGLWLGLDLASGLYVVMHTYLCDFTLSLSRSGLTLKQISVVKSKNVWLISTTNV